jgi:hypothetical protein
MFVKSPSGADSREIHHRDRSIDRFRLQADQAVTLYKSAGCTLAIVSCSRNIQVIDSRHQFFRRTRLVRPSNSMRLSEAQLVTDSELLAEYSATASDQAFEEIVRRYMNPVFGVCLRVLGNPAAAEDASQATFIILMRKAVVTDRAICGAGRQQITEAAVPARTNDASLVVSRAG